MPNVIRGDAAISACETGPETLQSLKLLQVMQAQGLLQSVISYNVAIDACADLRGDAAPGHQAHHRRLFSPDQHLRDGQGPDPGLTVLVREVTPRPPAHHRHLQRIVQRL